jgi:hypothetical protein
MSFFRADAVYAMPVIYERLQEVNYFHAIQLHTNAGLKEISLQLKLIKTGPNIVRHPRSITFGSGKAAITGPAVRVILSVIHRLRAPPSCA